MFSRGRLVHESSLFIFRPRCPPSFTVFSYTTLFRSMSELVRRPTFPADELERLKGQVLTDLKEMDDNTRVVSRSEEHTSELQSRGQLVCRLLLEKKKRCTCRMRRATREHSE